MSKQQSKSASTAHNAKKRETDTQKVYKSVGEIRKVFYPNAATGKASRGAATGRGSFVIERP